MSEQSVRNWALRDWVFQDWSANEGCRDAQLILVWFRLAQWARRRWGKAGRLLSVLYRISTYILLGIEIPPQVEIGPRLRLFHPHAIVLHPGVRMGTDCCLRQSVTIGNKIDRRGVEGPAATIGSDVEFGAGCVVVGDLHVGDHARIGALTVVSRSVPSWGVVVGNPGQVVRVEQHGSSA
jgi:serine acetyltransferase